MEFIRPDINLDFVGKRWIAIPISLTLIAISLVSLVLHGGPNYGVDFVGGTVIQVRFDQPVTAEKIRSAINPLGLAGATVQRFGLEGDEFRIRVDRTMESKDTVNPESVKEALAKATGVAVDIRGVEMVGPQVGKDLREKALLAILYALLFIAVYISGRFELKWVISAVMALAIFGAVTLLKLMGWSIPLQILAALVVAMAGFIALNLRFAMGAIVALIHDVTITVGVFSLLGLEFNLPIVAALLTIIGYSLNDTIIVYDRIRENSRKMARQGLAEIINRSVNETLSRTILTSSTVLIVVLALFLLGGGVIRDFAFAMMVGVVVGTYSSIYIASPILLQWQKRAAKR